MIIIPILMAVVIIGVISYSLFRDRQMMNKLKESGETLYLPIQDITVHSNRDRHNKRTANTYYIHYVLNGNNASTMITRLDYNNLVRGQLVPITHIDGYARYDIFGKQREQYTNKKIGVRVTIMGNEMYLGQQKPIPNLQNDPSYLRNK